MGISIPFNGTGTNQLDGLACVQYRDDPRLIVIPTGHAVTQDGGTDPLGIKATRDLSAFMLFRQDAVPATGADDDERCVRLSRWPDDELRNHHVGAVTVFIKNTFWVLAGLGLKRFGRGRPIPDGDRCRGLGPQERGEKKTGEA